MKIQGKLLLLFSLVISSVLFPTCDKEDPIPQLNIQFQAASASVAENAGSFSIPITLPGAAKASPTTIAYSVSGTAKSSDFTIDNSGSITIPANANLATITGKLTDNLDQDGSKTIIITITSVTFETKTIPLGTLNQSYTLTVTDDECSPYIAGTWNYTAKYFSIFQGKDIPAGNNGQGLDSLGLLKPEFKGSITITDPNKKRTYTISDAAIGQYSGLKFAAEGALLDNCGKLSTSADKPLLLAGALPVVLTGTITNATTISVTWNVYADPQLKNLAGKGSATLIKQ